MISIENNENLLWMTTGKDYDELRELQQIQNINKAKDVYDKQKKETEEAKYILDLLERNYVNTIASFQTVYDYCPEMLNKAIDEFYEKDKRKSRHNLEWLECRISKDFFDDKTKIKITEFSQYMGNGMGISTSLLIYFSYNDEEYEIEIPFHKEFIKIDSTSIQGKFGLYHKKHKYLTELLYASYSIKDVKNYILETIVKKTKE